MTETVLNRAVSFPGWESILQAGNKLGAVERTARHSGIVAYLSFLTSLALRDRLPTRAERSCPSCVK